jgi:hypothetical protein
MQATDFTARDAGIEVLGMAEVTPFQFQVQIFTVAVRLDGSGLTSRFRYLLCGQGPNCGQLILHQH